MCSSNEKLTRPLLRKLKNSVKKVKNMMLNEALWCSIRMCWTNSEKCSNNFLSTNTEINNVKNSTDIKLFKTQLKIIQYSSWFLGSFLSTSAPPLTHFSPVSHFYTAWKCHKTFGFLTSSGAIEMWYWTKMG